MRKNDATRAELVEAILIVLGALSSIVALALMLAR